MTRFIRCFFFALLTVTALTGAVPSFARHRHKRVAMAPAVIDRTTLRLVWLDPAFAQSDASGIGIIPAADIAAPDEPATSTDAAATEETSAEPDARAAEEPAEEAAPATDDQSGDKVRPDGGEPASDEPVAVEDPAATNEPAAAEEPAAPTDESTPVAAPEDAPVRVEATTPENEPVAVETTPTSEERRQEEPRRERKRRFRFGPEVGVFLPTDSKTRDRFGDSWFTFGLAFGAVGQADPKGRFEPDINFTYRNRGDDHIFMAPLGIGYRKALTRNPKATSSTYVGASVNAILTDIRSELDNVDTKLKVTGGGSVFAGVNFKDSAYLEVRYRVSGKVSGFNLSGTQLSAGFRF